MVVSVGTMGSGVHVNGHWWEALIECHWITNDCIAFLTCILRGLLGCLDIYSTDMPYELYHECGYFELVLLVCAVSPAGPLSTELSWLLWYLCLEWPGWAVIHCSRFGRVADHLPLDPTVPVDVTCRWMIRMSRNAVNIITRVWM